MTRNPYACCFPGCTRPVADSHTCEYHKRVRVSAFGSWVNDHHKDGGHG